MTKETMTLIEETQKFNKAVDLFFGMNPEKRLWILLMLYLGKEKSLRFVDNVSPEEYARTISCNSSYWHVIASLDIDDISNKKKVEEWQNQGIANRIIWAEKPQSLDCTLDELLYALDIDAHNLRESNNIDNVFKRHRWEPIFVFEVAETFMSLSEEWYEEKSTWAFNYIIRKMQSIYGKLNDLFVQPVEITHIVSTLLNADKGSVFNPYAGTGSYAMVIGDDCTYLGNELSQSNVLIAKLNLLINNRRNAVIERASSGANWVICDNQKFDYIVSTPPFRLPLQDSEYRTTDLDFLAKSSVAAQIRSVGVYPASICYNSNALYEQVLSCLVDEDILDTIVLLPTSLYPNTSIETSIIVVNKNKAQQGSVRFVDASDCYYTDGRVKRFDLSHWTYKLHHSTRELGVAYVPNDDIRSNGYKIYPKLYLGKNIEVPEGMREISLFEVLTPISTRLATSKQGRVFSFSQRDSINVGGIISHTDLDVRNIEVRDYRAINEDCLVIRRGGRFIAKYLITNGEDIYLNSSCRTFLVDTGIIDPIYLLSELSKDYFLEQVSRYGTSPAGPRMSIEDFLNLKILVPSVRDQQVKMSLDTIEKNVEVLESQKLAEYKNKMESFILNQRQRKHAVSQVLNEIVPSVENIETFILRNDNISRDSIVSPRFGTTLEAYLTSILRQLDKVVTMVDNFTSEEKFGEPQVISIEDFLSEYCESKRALNINVVYNHSYEEEEIEQEVKISKKDLTQMLDNLVHNAVKYGRGEGVESRYGSNDEKANDLQIRIETSAIHDYNEPVVIKVSNNGELVSKSISLDKLFVWGVGRGSGIGCSQVKEIAEYFGGSVSYQEYPDDPDGFACEFKIVLPLNDE